MTSNIRIPKTGDLIPLKCEKTSGNPAYPCGFIASAYGVNVFLPPSQIQLRRPTTSEMQSYLGRILMTKVLKIDRARCNIIVSRRAILDIESSWTLGPFKSCSFGDVLEGTVAETLDEIGYIVDLKGFTGLLNQSDINHTLELGQRVSVAILSIDREKQIARLTNPQTS